MNIFVLLLTLFVLNGHCNAAYISAKVLSEPSSHHTDQVDHSMSAHSHHGGSFDSGSFQTDGSEHCIDTLIDDPSISLLNVSVFKQLQDKQDDLKPMLLGVYQLPEVRAGPCISPPDSLSAELPPSALYYRLCVLRL